jgi:hypothetical protein
VFSTRRYEAKGTIQVQKESADAMGLDNLMNGAEGAPDALDANINLQTQVNIGEHPPRHRRSTLSLLWC